MLQILIDGRADVIVERRSGALWRFDARIQNWEGAAGLRIYDLPRAAARWLISGPGKVMITWH